MFEKIKIFVSTVKTFGMNTYNTVSNVVSNEKTADGVMRWPRPVAFFLIVAMFSVGWFHPATLLSFAQAIAVLPEHFWNIVYIILGSIAGSKVIKDAAKLTKK